MSRCASSFFPQVQSTSFYHGRHILILSRSDLTALSVRNARDLCELKRLDARVRGYLSSASSRWSAMNRQHRPPMVESIKDSLQGAGAELGAAAQQCESCLNLSGGFSWGCREEGVQRIGAGRGRSSGTKKPARGPVSLCCKSCKKLAVAAVWCPRETRVFCINRGL